MWIQAPARARGTASMAEPAGALSGVAEIHYGLLAESRASFYNDCQDHNRDRTAADAALGIAQAGMKETHEL